MFFVIIGMTIVFVIVVIKKERILVYDDGIRIKDFMYPLWIPNDTIVSLTMVDKLPKLIHRTNGSGFDRIQKGYFTIKKDGAEHSENATLYIRNRKSKAIEIRTVKGLVYVNCKYDLQTEELFDEMKATVKMLKEGELNYNAKRPRTYRSVAVIFLFFFMILFPIIFFDYENEIVLNEDMIEIQGDYSMEIPLSDIDTLMLVESLPSIKLRTNGISTRKVDIGNFKMSSGDKCRLYINKSTPMFIEIRLAAHNSQHKVIFINRKTVEETKSLYDDICAKKWEVIGNGER